MSCTNSSGFLACLSPPYGGGSGGTMLKWRFDQVAREYVTLNVEWRAACRRGWIYDIGRDGSVWNIAHSGLPLSLEGTAVVFGLRPTDYLTFRVIALDAAGDYGPAAVLRGVTIIGQ